MEKLKIDAVEHYNRSVYQHGTLSNRIYLMSLDRNDVPGIIGYLDALAEANGYTKIFAKVPAGQSAAFVNQDYLSEAEVPGLYNGVEKAQFLVKYFSDQRRKEKKPELVHKVLDAVVPLMTAPVELDLAPPFVCRRMTPDDTEEMASVYREVFSSYPFPIQDPAYLVKTMEEQVIYQGIRAGNELVALASAELDSKGENAEMTDFATRKEVRGQGFARILLARLEQDVIVSGVKTVYTIARAYSMGMNKTFAAGGYQFAGTLINNTQIAGSLESMNVWFKSIVKKT